MRLEPITYNFHVSQKLSASLNILPCFSASVLLFPTSFLVSQHFQALRRLSTTAATGSRRRNQKLMINIVGFFSRYTYHSLLVVQGSISIAYWSSQPSVPQHTTTPPGPPLLRRCVFLLGLAAFGSVRSYIFDYTARRAGGQPCRAIA